MKNRFFALVLCALFVFSGCSTGEVPSEVVLKGPDAVDVVLLVNEPNYAVETIVNAFAAKLGELTGKTVETVEKTDFSGEEYPIYIDTVDLDCSDNPPFAFQFGEGAKGSMDSVDEAIFTYANNYVLFYGEDSARIVAPNEFCLYHALDDFLEGFRAESHSVIAGTEKLVPCDSESMSPACMIDEVGDVRFLFTEYKVTFVEYFNEVREPDKVFLVDGDGRDGMQGGGTDGTYAYYALYENDISNIYKFDLSDWSLVDVSEALPTGHSNDITYVPEKHVLMVADCTEKDGWAGVHYIDPDTLEYLEYGLLPYGCRGLDYVPSLQQYVITGSYTHNIYDKDFNLIRSFNCGFPRDTTQGLYCDGSYIYDARWGENSSPDFDGSGNNHLLIHSLEGEYISEGVIEGDPRHGDSENENVFIHDNMFYVGYYNSPRTINEYVMVPVNMFE